MTSNKFSPFDYLRSINETKENILSSYPDLEDEYPAFVIKRGLSYFPDTISYAQNLNFFHQSLDNKLQYDYLINTIRPRKRYSGVWPKPLRDDDIEVIKKFFQVNTQKANSIKSILTESQLADIKDQHKMLSDNDKNE